jgi:hypothetical protein
VGDAGLPSISRGILRAKSEGKVPLSPKRGRFSSGDTGLSFCLGNRERIHQVEAFGVLGEDRREHAGDNVSKFR